MIHLPGKRAAGPLVPLYTGLVVEEALPGKGWEEFCLSTHRHRNDATNWKVIQNSPLFQWRPSTSGGEQRSGPRYGEVGRGGGSIGAESQRRAGGDGGGREESTGAGDASDRAAHVAAHAGHVCQVADAATIAAVVG